MNFYQFILTAHAKNFLQKTAYCSIKKDLI